jgi:hypothetical protein
VALALNIMVVYGEFYAVSFFAFEGYVSAHFTNSKNKIQNAPHYDKNINPTTLSAKPKKAQKRTKSYQFVFSTT